MERKIRQQVTRPAKMSNEGSSEKLTKRVGNEDTCEWVVENRSIGGHSTDEIHNSSSMNLQFRSIGVLNSPRKPSLHAHQCRSNSNCQPWLPYFPENNRGL
ncbi:hypothetical protein TIFTF001_002833 [Ficus carica]|uniref:Uncharacterized protein n=1 Tax=Ficus carica TaxID=3494 RepID=A0AA87Z5F1_FICCA|nr:hypothetical protein TIFTF001_002833 [Ficus carica]